MADTVSITRARGSADAANLTGTTLAPNVLASSLTSVGSLSALTMAGRVMEAKGADISSVGGVIAPGTDGNTFDITGTTTITEITAAAAGTVIWLQFDGALKVTHGTGANNPKLMGGFDFYTTAGSWLMLVSDGMNFWEIARRHGATTIVEAALGADVTLTDANTFYDGPSVSLPPGTWLLVGAVTVLDTASASSLTAKLWDGTNVESAAQATTSAANYCDTIPVNGVVTVASTTTWKISVANGQAASGRIKAAPPNNSPGNYASTLKATRIA